MRTGELIVFSFSILMCVPTLASLTKFDKWWIRGFDFPRIQISFLIITAIIASVLVYDFSESWHFIMVFFLVISLSYQFGKILPYTYLSEKQVLRNNDETPQANISILVSNVLASNKRSDKLIDLVRKRDPDLLLTLESDKRWEEELSILEEKFKYSVKVPQDNLYGMHLYSKLKLENMEVMNIIQKDIPSIHGVVILRNGKRVKLHCIHPKPPSPTENETSTNRDAELLLVGKELNAKYEPTLVIGDLNDVAWSRTTRLFQKLSGMMDPRIGRGFFNTYNANYFLLRWPLDHVFHSKDFTLIEISREKHIGSDHFPIYINLNYEPSAKGANEDTDQANQEEEKWAEEKIQSADPLRQKISYRLPEKILKIF